MKTLRIFIGSMPYFVDFLQQRIISLRNVLVINHDEVKCINWRNYISHYRLTIVIDDHVNSQTLKTLGVLQANISHKQNIVIIFLKAKSSLSKREPSVYLNDIDNIEANILRIERCSLYYKAINFIPRNEWKALTLKSKGLTGYQASKIEDASVITISARNRRAMLKCRLRTHIDAYYFMQGFKSK
ncbi:hypothetical protein ACMV5I_28610 [Serratia sp. T13T92]|uniref:hypothetical protein n=1 Tax=Serratia sp. T13T92 TaxID=3397496 RepID=UPI0039DFF200